LLNLRIKVCQPPVRPGSKITEAKPRGERPIIYEALHLVSIRFALLRQTLIGGARMLIDFLGLVHFIGFDETLFLRPALIDAFQAPLSAALGGANRPVIDQNKNWIGV